MTCIFWDVERQARHGPNVLRWTHYPAQCVRHQATPGGGKGPWARPARLFPGYRPGDHYESAAGVAHGYVLHRRAIAQGRDLLLESQ